MTLLNWRKVDPNAPMQVHVIKNRTPGVPPFVHNLPETLMPNVDDEAWVDINAKALLPNATWPIIPDTAYRLARFERAGVPMRGLGPPPGEEPPSVPFWALVLEITMHKLGRQRMHRVLRHAVLFPEWRAAAMSYWRLGGDAPFQLWLDDQHNAGEFNLSRERVRRIKQRQRNEQRKRERT